MAVHAPERPTVVEHTAPNPVLHRVGPAALLVLVVYGILAAFGPDGVGYLSTDTGGKVATLEAMGERGDWDPDIGYWAEDFDPDGSLHPQWFTARIDDRWVNVTTLPMLLAGKPLYDLGGYRLALLLPMLGSLAAAFGARALARRLAESTSSTADRAGWLAFWLVALASPLLVYALDFWEHAPGVALVVWATVALVDVGRTGRWPLALVAGLGFGLAATMRTEAFVFAFALTAAFCISQLPRLGRAVTAGLGVTTGFGATFAANAALERVVIGDAIRAERATGTAAAGAGDLGLRIDEAFMTGLGIDPSGDAASIVSGVVILAAVALLARPSKQQPDEDHDARPVIVAAVLLGAVYLARFTSGTGFVPGLVPSTPVAAVAIVWGWRVRAARTWLAGLALAVPLVWLFQYTGGAAPQWAGRYLLPAGTLLIAIAAVELARRPAFVRGIAIGAALAITAFGALWTHERTTGFDGIMDELANRPEPVLVFQPAFLAREGGPHHVREQWLTAPDADRLDEAGRLLVAADIESFGLVRVADDDAPRIAGFTAAAESAVSSDLFPVRVVTYERTESP